MQIKSTLLTGMFDPKTLCREVANRDRVDGRSLPQLQITACAHETVQRVPPFKVPTTEVFCLHGFVDWCRFASTSIHCPSAADMGEVLLARLLLFLLACCLPPCLLPQVPQMGAWAHRTLEPADEPLLHEHYCMNSSSHGAWSKNPSQKS